MSCAAPVHQWDAPSTLPPLSHGPLNSDSQSGSNSGSTQMCVHTGNIAVRRQYVGNPVVEKMAFNEVLLLFIFFWLRWRRLRLAQARIRRTQVAQSNELAVVVAQWRLMSQVAISAALRLLQGNRLKRQVWAKPRRASLYQDIVLGWNDNYFKTNFHVSHTNFAYLVNKLQPVLQRQQLLHSILFHWTTASDHTSKRATTSWRSMSVRPPPFLTRS